MKRTFKERVLKVMAKIPKGMEKSEDTIWELAQK